MPKDTSELMKILENTTPGGMEMFETQYLSNKSISFSDYISELMQKKGLKRQNIIIMANLPQKYGYKLLSGETHTTNRDKILRICFSMKMSLKEVQTALKLYGMSELYPKIKRDAMIIVAFNNKMYSVDEVSKWLVQNDEQPLE